MRKLINTNSLFFAPTFIGLLHFALLLFCVVVFKSNFKTETVFKFNLPSSNPKYTFSETSLLKQLREYSVSTYFLKGDLEDENKIAVIRLEALKIKYSCNLYSAIKIHLADETTYGEFIKLIEIANKDHHTKYGLIENDFYFFPPNEFECDNKKKEVKEELPIA